ncbi:zinc-ribbon domain-containing protein [Massilia sp. TN1-12]|uniref:zinc-ribbon domain-containing protein n=1 Tax=Massilia paldalensis TaxID=3377675 RepID=UPI00384B0D2F
MALIACHECGAQVSTEAAACPNCGARPQKAQRSRALLYALLGISVIFVTWALVRTPSAEEVASSDARMAISVCWDDQKTKSYEPSTARFVAGVCEKMERDYRAKFGRNP